MPSKTKKSAPLKGTADEAPRALRGRTDRSAMFPGAVQAGDLPADYAARLAEMKGRIHGERLRLVLATNSVMVLLCWDIGQRILHKQAEQGYGTEVVGRLAADLREALLYMKGFSPRNLRYMRAFAAAWADRSVVQRTVAQLTWGRPESGFNQKSVVSRASSGCQDLRVARRTRLPSSNFLI